MKRSRGWNTVTTRKRACGSTEPNPLELLGTLASLGKGSENPSLGRGLGEDPDTKLYAVGRHIYFQDDIDFDTASALIKQINELADELEYTAKLYDLEPIPIVLHITSPGGVVFAAYSIVDAMLKCKVPVDTIVDGYAASCGTIISIHGRHRSIGKHGIMLCHQVSSGMWGSYTEEEQKDHQVNLDQMSNTIRRMYTERTNMTKKELKELLKHDMDWNAEECLRRGLVDEINY